MIIRNNSDIISFSNHKSKSVRGITKALEEISTGYKINRAADDAAGLSISEKMRSQIAGLKQTEQNITDAIGYIKTADSGMQKMNDIMGRMNTLAIQARDGVYESDVDLVALDREYQQLKKELNDICGYSTFNNLSVFDLNEEEYNLIVGNRIAENRFISITDGLNDELTIGLIYTDVAPDGTKTETRVEVSFDLEAGIYEHMELADIIDDLLIAQNPDVIFGVSPDGYYSLRSENAQIEYIKGGASALFYDYSPGSAPGSMLIGMTTFVGNYPLNINANNQNLEFYLGDIPYSITLAPGSYTRAETINLLNDAFKNANIDNEIRAVEYYPNRIAFVSDTTQIHGLSGNFIKIDGIASPLYDIAGYSDEIRTAGMITGKVTIPSNTLVERGVNDYFTLRYYDYETNSTYDAVINLLDTGVDSATYTETALVNRINAEIAAKIKDSDGNPLAIAELHNGTLRIRSTYYGDKSSISLVSNGFASNTTIYDFFDKRDTTEYQPTLHTGSINYAKLTGNNVWSLLGNFPYTVGNGGDNVLKINVTHEDSANAIPTEITLPVGTTYNDIGELATYIQNALNTSIQTALGVTGTDFIKVSTSSGVLSIESVDYKISAINAEATMGYYELLGGVNYSGNVSSANGGSTAYGGVGSSPNMGYTIGKASSDYSAGANVPTAGKSNDLYSDVKMNTGQGTSKTVDGSTATETTPAVTTNPDFSTHFTDNGKTAADKTLTYTYNDSNDPSKTGPYSITVDAGKTMEEAIAQINAQTDGKVIASLLGNELVLTSVKGGEEIIIDNIGGDLSRAQNTPGAGGDINYTAKKIDHAASISLNNFGSHFASGDVTINSSNNKFTFQFNDGNGLAEHTLTLDDGIYDAARMAAEIQKQIDNYYDPALRGKIDVSLSGNSLKLTSVPKGADVSISDLKGSSNLHLNKNPVAATPATATNNNLGISAANPLVVTAGSNDEFTFSLTDDSGTTTPYTLKLVGGKTYTDASQIVEDLNADAIANGVPVSFEVNGSGFKMTSQIVGQDVQFSSIGGSAQLDKTRYLNTVPDGATVDTGNNAINTAAHITNNEFSTLFGAGGLRLDGKNNDNTFSFALGSTNYNITIPPGIYKDTDIPNIISQINTQLNDQWIANGSIANDKITASYENGALVLRSTATGTGINLSSVNLSGCRLFQKETSYNASSTGGTYSFSSLTGRTNVSSYTIRDSNNVLEFKYKDENTSTVKDIQITIDKGDYTGAELVTYLQTKINEALDSATNGVLVEVSLNSSNCLVFETTNVGEKYKVDSFSGSFYEKALKGYSYYGHDYHTTTKGALIGNPSTCFIVGRNNLEMANASNHLLEGMTVINQGVNDTFTFDFTDTGIDDNGNTIEKKHTITITLTGGRSYSPTELADHMQDLIDAEIKDLEDNYGNKYGEGFIIAQIGGIASAINTDGKLVLRVKDIPDDGTFKTSSYVIDGVRGNSVYSIFYESPWENTPARTMGSADISGGFLIEQGIKDTFIFEVNGTPITVTFPTDSGNGEVTKFYTADELIAEINNQIPSNLNIIASLYDGHLLRLSFKDLGLNTIDKISGNLRNDIFYSGGNRMEDEDVYIQSSNEAYMGLTIEKNRISTELMRINTTLITSPERAAKALDRLDDALQYVLSYRSKSGATHNRMEHVLDRNINAGAQLSEAESRIRNADVAKSIMKKAKNEILSNAVDSVMTQSNRLTGSVLDVIKYG